VPRLVSILLIALATRASAGSGVSYAYEVRPILADKCFACHGPDASKRDSGLRLDSAEGAAAALKDSPEKAIVPGDPGKSVVWQRISSKDPEQIMPPPKSHLTLSDGEKGVLRRWIEQGAKYEPHWAFQPIPDSVAVPELKDPAWPKETLDRFVLSRLEGEGITPSSAADPLRWLRSI
jgi:hypothetical protein